MPELRLDLWRETESGRASLINHSENHTYRVDGPHGPVILRVHRPGYQNASSIASELSWIEALARDTDLPVVRPLPGRNGELLQEIEPGRYAVLFAFAKGAEPHAGEIALFRTIGGFAAKTHLHIQSWSRPPTFTRPTWSAANMLAPDGLWGNWRDAPGVDAERATLDAVNARLHETLAAYGQTADRFGLIHADMRLANLLVDGPRVTLLDFDDCGFGWFMYDLASALSFIETSPDVPALQAAWLDGYTAIRPLSGADRDVIPAMVLLRRMVLLAWISTHGETRLAQSQAPHFASGTAQLGRRWLSQL